MSAHTSFFRGLWQGSAPLLIWGCHFFTCYIAIALGCDQHVGQGEWLGVTGLQWSLLVFTAITVITLGCMAFYALHQVQRHPKACMLAWIRMIGAALAAVAALWVAVPLQWLSACHFT